MLIPGTVLQSASYSLLFRLCLLQAKLVAHLCAAQDMSMVSQGSGSYQEEAVTARIGAGK